MGKVLALQNKKGSCARTLTSDHRIGFVLSTKDRTQFTRRCLPAIDDEGGFDLIWVDGSLTDEGRTLPYEFRSKEVKVAEVHSGVGGGADAAVVYSLKRLLDLGYDYCGLIENDVLLRPGWFLKLLDTWNRASYDGLAVGAATVRNYESRVMEYCNGYTINWCMGAGMVLFSREAAQAVLNNYSWTSVRKIYRYFSEEFQVSLKGIWELWRGFPDTPMVPDWNYAPTLYREGLVSIGSIPSLATDLQFNIHKQFKTNYVESGMNNAGRVRPWASSLELALIRLTDPIYSAAWKAVGDGVILETLSTMARRHTNALRRSVEDLPVV